VHAGAGMHVWCIYECVNVNSCASGANVCGACMVCVGAWPAPHLSPSAAPRWTSTQLSHTPRITKGAPTANKSYCRAPISHPKMTTLTRAYLLVAGIWDRPRGRRDEGPHGGQLWRGRGERQRQRPQLGGIEQVLVRILVGAAKDDDRAGVPFPRTRGDERHHRLARPGRRLGHARRHRHFGPCGARGVELQQVGAVRGGVREYKVGRVEWSEEG
jgi:hypothetical protein